MKSNKIFKLCTALFMALVSLSIQADTKKLYGIEGAKLVYHKLSKKPYTYVVKGVRYTTLPYGEGKKLFTKRNGKFLSQKISWT